MRSSDDDDHLLQPGLLTIASSTSETIHLSLPEEWKRGEVRGVALADIGREDATFGFIRWALPTKAEVTYKLPSVPTSLLVHNPSGSSLKIELTTIDLTKETVEKNVILVSKTPALLW